MEHADFAQEYVDHFLSDGGIPSPGVVAEIFYTRCFLGDAPGTAAVAALMGGDGVEITAEEIADVGRR
jgi:hypothetical protein